MQINAESMQINAKVLIKKEGLKKKSREWTQKCNLTINGMKP